MSRPRVALTPGDPLGIGAEVGILAWEACRDEIDVVLVGDEGLWARAAELRGVVAPSSGLPVCRPGPLVLASQPLPEIAAVVEAVRGCQDGRWDAMATGPIHKKRALDAGFPFAGHTEFLASLCGLPPEDAVMVFLGGRLVVALVTVHVPLSAVAGRITPAALCGTAKALHGLLQGRLGVKTPRIACCGLNPHAGEEGALGTEERDIIAPSLDLLRVEGLHVDGPFPADTLFGRAASGAWDGVIALYHDQGLIPAKVLDFGRTVNVTAGLPIVRTSVDHGTARDIAWTGKADPGSMIAALRWAARLSRPPARGSSTGE